MSALTVHCLWEDEAARKRIDHPPPYVEAKTIKLLTLHTHDCLVPVLWAVHKGRPQRRGGVGKMRTHADSRREQSIMLNADVRKGRGDLVKCGHLRRQVVEKRFIFADVLYGRPLKGVLLFLFFFFFFAFFIFFIVIFFFAFFFVTFFFSFSFFLFFAFSPSSLHSSSFLYCSSS